MNVQRRRRRNARARRSRTPALEQAPWRAIENAFPPVAFYSADQTEAIHDSSLSILEPLGVELLDDRACCHFAATGIWNQALEECSPPELPEDRSEALEANVARRKEEIEAKGLGPARRFR